MASELGAALAGGSGRDEMGGAAERGAEDRGARAG